jgi:hypothetical protein
MDAGGVITTDMAGTMVTVAVPVLVGSLVGAAIEVAATEAVSGAGTDPGAV